MIEDKIINILKEIRPEFDFNLERTGFVAKGMLDSFDLISIVSDMEALFDTTIDGAKILPENFDSIATIASLIDKKTL
jgi:acyl carrier protein|tara:strand:+ start:243 stop:476 length:234 start_codon:yes stop_codon:yes gene_type:complete